MTTLPVGTDEQARRVIRGALDRTVIVEAAAGTGKTTELVHRIIGVIREGMAEMRGIVAVTFTEKAAGELRLRLRQRLEDERQQARGVEAERFERAVQTLEEAHVSTIHGFCADLLRERPVEAQVDPLFRVLTESQANALLSEVFDGWLRGHLEAPPEGVRRSLRRNSRWFADETGGPVDRLRHAVVDLSQWRDCRTPWRREPFDRSAAIAALVTQVHELSDLTSRPGSLRDNLYVDCEPVRNVSAAIRRQEHAGGPTDEDGLEALLVELARNRGWLRARKGSGAVFAPGIARAFVLERRDRLIEALHEFRLRADADLAAALQQELFDCLDLYEDRKAAEGALDFLDLLVVARALVRDNRLVRSHFQRRFTHVFVDEFQDTDPLQAELLLLLAASDSGEDDWRRVTPVPGKLFVVGDPKQSIYRFRRADLAVYRQVCAQLEAAGAMRVELRRSFRSVPALQRFVNAAFAPVMDGSVEREQARYVPLEADRSDPPEQPAVVALPVPEPYGSQSLAVAKIEESLPDAVGAYVHWLVRASGWQVTERRNGQEVRVPLAERHICILFRRFVSFGRDVTRPYLDALEARGVRHLLVGGRAFHAREEIDTLRAALMAVEWPDDQLSVFATLRGSLFAIGDEELLEYSYRGGRFHPFRAAPPDLPGRLAPIVETLEFLKTLHVRRNRRPVADTITDLLTHTRAHVGFVLRPNGEQVLANVMHVAQLARQYELDGGMSFRGFVDRLRDESADSRAAEAPILEDGSEGVRLMTVHKAKGLEFPVVVLADITCRLTPNDVNRAVELDRGVCALRIGGWAPQDLLDRQEAERGREQAEGERLAYVAATRARDLLVVAAVGDAPWDGGWVSPLNGALYPPLDVRRQPGTGRGVPPFASKDTVLTRPGGDPAGPATVAPGAHLLGDGGERYEVVWWSPEPKVLPLRALPAIGLRREDLVVKDVSPSTRERYLAEYRAWETARRAAVASGASASLDVLTVTAAAADPAVTIEEAEVQVERLEIDAGRPTGVRFGSLMHVLLAEAPLDFSRHPPELLVALAEAHGRLLGATREEIVAAGQAAVAALAHPLLQRAARAGHGCFRETSVTLRMPSGLLVEGTVDLAFDDEGTFVVVDFKTDVDLDGSLELYRRQVQLYVRAITDATGRPARGVLMRV